MGTTTTTTKEKIDEEEKEEIIIKKDNDDNNKRNNNNNNNEENNKKINRSDKNSINNNNIKILKKRLKKLRKKAYNNQKQHSNYSGILTIKEYNELKVLNYQIANKSDKITGTCLFINIQKGSLLPTTPNNNNTLLWKKCEGIDIRNIILNILLYNDKKVNEKGYF